MDKSAALLCNALKLIACGFLYGFGAPICTHIGENLSTVCKKLHKQHSKTVEYIVFGSENIRLSCTVPVKRCVQHSLGEVAVGVEVCPLTLTLEACGDSAADCVVTYFFLLGTVGEIFVAVIEVFYYAHHLNDKFPVLFLLLVCAAELLGVLVKAFLALFTGPFKCLLIFGFIINALRHSADYFYLIDRFNTHTEIFFNKCGVDDRAADTHCDRAYL